MLLLYVTTILTMLFDAYKVSFNTIWLTFQEKKEEDSQKLMKTIKMLVLHMMMFQWLVRRGIVLQRLMKTIKMLVLHMMMFQWLVRKGMRWSCRGWWKIFQFYSCMWGRQCLAQISKVQIPIQISSVIYILFQRINIFQPSQNLSNSSFQPRIFKSI